MLKRLLLASVLTITACGQVDEPNQLNLKDSLGTDDSELGLQGSSGKQWLGQLQGSKAGLNKVLNGLRSFRNSVNQKCHGFLAYEDSPGDKVTVSFYTAVHCLEYRDPLGRLQKVDFKFLESIKYRDFDSGFDFDVKLKSGKEHLFEYPSGKTGDVGRFVQERIPKWDAQRSLLPVCADNVVNTGYLQAFGTARYNGKDRPSWANFGYNGSGFGLPTAMRELMNEMGIHPSQGRAYGVRTNPGDSGSPVFMVQPQKGQPALKSVAEYQCLFGLVTRELWTEECQRSGINFGCNAWGDSLFERTYGPSISSTVGSWTPARTVRAATVERKKKLEDESRKKKEEDDKRKKAEDERRKKADDDKRKKDEDERRKKADDDKRKKDEDERRKKVDDDKRKKDEDERRKKVEAEQRKRAEAEQRKRAEDEQRKRAEDQRRKKKK